MKTHFSDPEYGKRVAMLQTQAFSIFPPAIPYVKAKKKADDQDESSKDTYQKIEVPIDPMEVDGKKTEWKVPMFHNGTPEEFVKWRTTFEELVEALNLETPIEKH